MEKTEKNIIIIRAGLIAVGIILVVIGIHNGGYTDIMNKAIRICYECIGIG